jgi:pimeloyl-ACP methyl ester carboxylesterase
MLKPLFVPFIVTAACATHDKPAAPGGNTTSVDSRPETTGNVSFTKSKDGTRIAFESVGAGPALILVGGALSDRDGGKPLARKLREHFTVLMYDRRGRGESGDTKPYAVDREIEDLAALIERANSQAFLYGVSSGAALALQAAAKLGADQVPKLAVYDAPYGQDQRAFDEQKNRVHQLVQTGKPGDAAAFFFTAIGTPPEALEGMKRSPEWETIKKTDFTLNYDYAVLGDGAVPDAVKRITAPTLVMVGEKSMPFMHATADRIAELVPNAERKTVGGQAHQAAPEAVVPLLRDFFGGKVRPDTGATTPEDAR